jgi:type IV secretion system protein VirB10
MNERDIRPIVPLPREAIPWPVMAVVLAMVAVGLFLMLDGPRRGMSDGQAPRVGVIEAAPALVVPREVEPSPAPVLVTRAVVEAAPAPKPLPYRPPLAMPQVPYTEDLAPPPPRPARIAREGARESPLVIDLTQGPGAAVQGGQGGDQAAPDDTARATLIHHRAGVIPQGAIIAAVLETPLNSDRPGLARALVSKDVRGFDGARVLIPRGSRLMGEFKADATPGKRRVLVMWSRLVRPDGVAIRLESPATDALGGAGIGGHVDDHFIEKFTNAVLQSALSVGVNVASAQWSKATGSAVYLGSGATLSLSSNRAATVMVHEGTEIAVLVAHDLDFSGTPAMR